MPSENERRHTEVRQSLTGAETPQQRSLSSYWSGISSRDLEREHAREEAAIDKRLERMKSRGLGFAVAQTL